MDANEKLSRPVIIHRAILGSVERMLGILIEHTGGKWPLWLSPRQAIVVPVSHHFYDYAEKVRQEIHAAGFYVDVDVSGSKLDKKIREAQLAQYNFILVVGEKEQAEHTVNVRTRDNVIHGRKEIVEAIAEWNALIKQFK